MGDHLFRDVVEPSIKVGNTRGCTVGLSIAAHTLLIAAAIIVPLVAIDSSMLPAPSAMFAFITEGTPPVEPPVAPRRRDASQEALTVANPAAAPLEPPLDITSERPLQPNRELLVGIENNNGTGVVPGLGIEHPVAPPPPPTAPPTAPAVATPPVHPGGDIKRPTKLKDVPPQYPRIAQISRVQGYVIIEATIGPTGSVQDARILRSVPLLDAAALEAVRQWEYTPTLLNGMPVSVLMTITVNFTLR
jgi:protein TonB